MNKLKDAIFYPGRIKSFNLESPKSVKLPAKVCCLYVRSDWDRLQINSLATSVSNVTQGFIKEVEACFWTYKNGKETRSQPFQCFRARQFWDHIYYRSREGGTLWIFCWDAWPYWCLLNGRKEIDEKRMLLNCVDGKEMPYMQGERPRRTDGIFVAENPPTIISLAIPGGGRVKILDLRNYGIEPSKMNNWTGELQLDNVRVAVKDYREMIQRFDMGSWQTTAASQAWYCFRRSHLQYKVEVNPIKKVLELEQASYFGGRCEVKQMGKLNGLTYHLDVNSMYTGLAGLFCFPTRHVATLKDPSISEANDALIKYIGCADVTLKTDEPIFPTGEHVREYPFAIPKRAAREKLIFPTGEFRTALCGAELLTAMDGYVTKVHRLQLYESQPLLRSWSEFALGSRKRIQGSDLKHMEHCFKKIMNCLPGKFGQRSKEWLPFTAKKTKKELEEEKHLWIQEWGLHPETGELTQYRTINNETTYLDDELLGNLSCPIVSACWTSLGRTFLRQSIDYIGVDNVYYYDTDSLIVNEKGYLLAKAASWLNDLIPLKWKVREYGSDVHIYGIRRYRFEKRFCVSGPFGAEFNGSVNPVAWIEHENFTNQMQHGRACESARVERMARLQQSYRHGFVSENGRVYPFIAGDLKGQKYTKEDWDK